MKYIDENELRLGDKVELWPENEGQVVCAIDADEYARAYPKSEWGYLSGGALILTQKAGLVYYQRCDERMRLISRCLIERD